MPSGYELLDIYNTSPMAKQTGYAEMPMQPSQYGFSDALKAGAFKPGDRAAQGASMGGGPGAIAGAALGTLEAGFDIWQGLEANEQAKKNYAMQKQRYEAELAEREEEKRRRLEAQRLAEVYASANTAQQTGDAERAKYQQYWDRVGV